MQANKMKEEVTNRIIEALESGTAPWRQSWTSAGARAPRNSQGRAYRGVNVLLLMITAINEGFTSPYWLTFNHVQEREAKIKKGSKGTRIYWFNSFEKERKDKNKQPVRDEKGEVIKDTIPYFKAFTVWNADQIEGLSDSFYVDLNAGELDQTMRFQEGDEFIANTGAEIHECGADPCYIPGTDQIMMPTFQQFETAEEFYTTALHELSHWTKHPDRKDRDFKESHGDKAYPMEELVAEISAAFTAAYLEMNVDFGKNTAAYIDHWIQHFKDDKAAFHEAVKHAQRASDYLVSLQGQEDSEGLEEAA